MKVMLVLWNKDYAVFFEKGQEEEAKKFRESHPQMKYARIIEHIQMLPSQIRVGKIYERN